MIGIYGGTFDPVHYGHLRTALEVQEQFALAQLRLLPCYQSPLKNSSQATAQQRLQMLMLAIENQAGLICDTRELERKGASYMVDTLSSLRAELPDQSLLLFIGNDAFANLTNWHQWQRLFDYAHLVVMSRPGSEKARLDDFLQLKLCTDRATLKTQKAGKLFFQAVTPLDISASMIRALLAQQRSVRFLMPDTVIDYIKVQKLYQIQQENHANQ